MAGQSRAVTLFGGVDMEEDAFSPWVFTNGATIFSAHLSFGAVGAPTGTFTIEGSNDPIIDTEKSRGVASADSAAKFFTLAPDHTTGDLTPAGGPGEVYVATAFPPRWVRVKYDATSGGAGNILFGWGNG